MKCSITFGIHGFIPKCRMVKVMMLMRRRRRRMKMTVIMMMIVMMMNPEKGG